MLRAVSANGYGAGFWSGPGAGKQQIGLKEQDALNGGVQYKPPLVSSR
jgi:hypothetical protein